LYFVRLAHRTGEGGGEKNVPKQLIFYSIPYTFRMNSDEDKIRQSIKPTDLYDPTRNRNLVMT